MVDTDTSLNCTNAAFVALTASQACLHLYWVLHKLDWQVLLFSMDSLLCEYQEDIQSMPNGKYLGQWESESNNVPMTEFVSIGPKSYGYRYGNECRLKFDGFTLDHETTE